MSSPPADLVSIIMPCHNSEAFIYDAIRSVVAQTYRNWELLIVDDCSTDGTMAAIESARATHGERIQVQRLSVNSGAAVARNVAIQSASGRFIAFLDSDDLWLPAKLETQVCFMNATRSPFTYTAYEMVDEQGGHLSWISVPESTDYQALLKTNIIACLTAMYDAAYFGKICMPNIRKGQDYAMWLRLLKLVSGASGVQEVLAKYRVRGDSISANKWESSGWVWRVYREIEQLSVLTALWYFGHYALRGAARRIFR